ncbi:MAG: mechanosensitive ion channel family protein [Planctomycetes bacterium]|nr:mechanosensitive ion channel family protein [Planctomycetota bacterium]
MPPAFNIQQLWTFPVLDNPVWKWAVLLAVLLATGAVGKIVSFMLARQGRRFAQRERLKLLQFFLESASKPAQWATYALGLLLAQNFLILDKSIRQFWIQLGFALGYVAAAWFIFRMVDVLEFYLKKLTVRTETTLDDLLVPLLRKTLRVFIIIVATIFIAQNVFNMQLGSILAGLGIGGLAFALAAKDSIANLFGSIVIFADRPFSIGDRVKIQSQDGFVEEVGFRSTKLRTLDGHLVTVPNSSVANEMVENVSKRPAIKRVMTVTVTYNTTAEKVQRGVDILREILDSRMEHFHDDYPPQVFFNDFGADTLDIIVYYWFAPPDWWQYLKFNHDFNLELLRRFNAEGIEFAFPTRTLYLRPEGQFAATVRTLAPTGPEVGS